jgi:DNA uptake protein ComE-like DNA-binding protein
MRVTVGNSCLGLAAAGLILLTACNPPSNDQQLKEQAAQATEQAKQTAKDALAQAKVAAANGEQAVNDVAAGVKQGLDTKSLSSDSLVDLNTASAARLVTLPGISVGKARSIIHHRPYSASHDLVKDGILTEDEYGAIAPKVTVH